MQKLSDPSIILDFLVPQLEEASARLKMRRGAIVRLAGDWEPTFFVLEPEGDVTRFSVLGTIPRPWADYCALARSFFWTPEPVAQRAALHAYIEEHRQSMHPGLSASRAERELQGIELPTRGLVEAL